MLQKAVLHIFRFRKSELPPVILVKTAFLFLLLTGMSFSAFSKSDDDYDEILVYFSVPKVGGSDIPAVIRNETLYLPVTDVFSFLKIKNSLSAELDSVTGFFIDQKSPYVIDKQNNRIFFQDKVYDLKNDDIVKTSDNLYLKSSYFGQVFGLDCSFSFRSLSVILTTKIELPVIREMHQEQVRLNINKLKGEVKADTIIKRSFPAFHFGMADWSVVSTQELSGRTDTRFNLGLGTVIAGGEANANLIFYNNQPFREKQQQYLWRYVNNESRNVKQVIAGKIATQATSSIYAPVVGMQVTNTPTTFRRSFGSYTLSNRTEPGWTVELYVNNVLVDYVVADASGFYTFQVPLVYGNSDVMLRFYGPWGEEKFDEQNISIPFSFLPKGEMEYTASAGIVEDSVASRFSRATINYGLVSRLTVGTGAEYLSSVSSGPAMPFVNASLRLGSAFLVSGEYTYGVRSKAILNYRLASNMQFELYFTDYDKNQKAINYNYLQERKAVFSVPLSTKKISAFTRVTLNQIILPESKYTTTEWLLSGAMRGVSTNLTTYAMLADLASPYIYSNLSLSFRLPASFVLIPQAQYEYNDNKLISIKCGVEKHLFGNGFFSLSYEKNFKSDLQNIELGLRYDLSFAQLAFTARQSNKTTQFTESARGSLIYDRKTELLTAGNRTSVGKGGIAIIPYLDINCNGKRDKNEPKIAGLNIRITGGRIENNGKDSVIRVFDLEPYTSYFLEFDKNSFDNIAWQLRNKSMKVAIDPNQFKLIEVPIAVYGEASGMVYINRHGNTKGQGRVIVCFYNKKGKLAGRTLSESDGYFSFLGLPPGDYTAAIDTTQLRKINMEVSPALVPFTIERSEDGDVKDDFEFTLKSLKPEMSDDTETASPEIETPTVTSAPLIKLETTRILENTKAETAYPRVPAENEAVSPKTAKAVILSNPLSTNSEMNIKGDFAIQVGAFKIKENALNARAHLILSLGQDAVIIEEDGYYKVIITGFDTYLKAKEFLPLVKIRDNQDAFIRSLSQVSGAVYFGSNERKQGIGAISVEIYNNAGKRIAQTLTEADGSFKIMGLPTGEYIMHIDSGRLQKDNMISNPAQIAFKLERSLFTFGRKNFEFKLSINAQSPEKEEHGLPAAKPLQSVKENVKISEPKVNQMISNSIEQQNDNAIQNTEARKISTLPGNFAFQLGAYLSIDNALKARSHLIDALKKDIFIVEENGLFKPMVTGFDKKIEAEEFLTVVQNRGYDGAFIVKIR